MGTSLFLESDILTDLPICAGGAVGALMLRAMLTSLGLKKTMIVFACIDAAMLTIATLLIKERKTPLRQEKKIVWLDRSFLVDPVFWSLGISLFLCVMYVHDADHLTKRKTGSCPDLLIFNSQGDISLQSFSFRHSRRIRFLGLVTSYVHSLPLRSVDDHLPAVDDNSPRNGSELLSGSRSSYHWFYRRSDGTSQCALLCNNNVGAQSTVNLDFDQ